MHTALTCVNDFMVDTYLTLYYDYLTKMQTLNNIYHSWLVLSRLENFPDNLKLVHSTSL